MSLICSSALTTVDLRAMAGVLRKGRHHTPAARAGLPRAVLPQDGETPVQLPGGWDSLLRQNPGRVRPTVLARVTVNREPDAVDTSATSSRFTNACKPSPDP